MEVSLGLLKQHLHRGVQGAMEIHEWVALHLVTSLSLVKPRLSPDAYEGLEIPFVLCYSPLILVLAKADGEE